MLVDVINSTPIFANETEEKISKLMDELEAIFGKPKVLNESELARESEIMERIEEMWDEALSSVKDSFSIPDPDKLLSSSQNAQLSELENQINELYGVKSYENLTDVEQARVDEINQILDELILLPVEGDTPAIDPVIPEEISDLYQRLDEIYGTPKLELNPDEMEQEAAILEKINAIFENNKSGILTEPEVKKLDSLFTDLDSIYGVRSYSALSEKEKAEVDDIYKKIDEYYAENNGGCICEVEPALLELDDALFV